MMRKKNLIFKEIVLFRGYKRKRMFGVEVVMIEVVFVFVYLKKRRKIIGLEKWWRCYFWIVYNFRNEKYIGL